jgi:sRNA-binding protein
MTEPVSRRPTRELWKILRQRWPRCFGQIRPLKIGIHADLLAIPDLGLDADEVDKVLCNYVRKVPYLELMLEGAARVDLDGNAVGEVTVDQATGAQWLLLNIVRPRQEQWLAENAQQLQQQRQERRALDLARAKERRKARKQQKRAAAAAKAAAAEAQTLGNRRLACRGAGASGGALLGSVGQVEFHTPFVQAGRCLGEIAFPRAETAASSQGMARRFSKFQCRQWGSEVRAASCSSSVAR